MRPVALALSLILVVGISVDSHAQCCGTPTVAYSPVVAAAPAPVVAQTTYNDGWYPGKALGNLSRNLFGGGTTTTTYTAGYVPYTAAYAPSYSVGYAPTPYYAGYATTAYRPTYPATWGAVAYTPAVQTVSRPVVLSPVVQAPACSACDACSGVAQASYLLAPSSTCSSCNSASDYVIESGAYESTLEPAPYEPAPALAPTDNPPPTRSQRPEFDDTDSILDEDPKTPTDAASSNEYWKAPPLFAPPANRVTQITHPAPVHTAVYRQPVENHPATFEPTPAGKTHHLSADGWAVAD